jgi:hypothetical protein
MRERKPAKLNDASGVGYAETFRNNRGGRQGQGRIWISTGAAILHQQMMRGDKMFFSGTIYDDDREVQHTCRVAITRFTGSNEVEFVAEWDPLADYTE